MGKVKFLKTSRTSIALSLFFLFYFFSSLIVASDFNFYETDLIAKESYRKISMDFQNASLTNILKIFSEQAGLNFIASQNVQDRQVTLYLDNVPLQEALKKIMSANNLKYVLDPGSNVFIVKETGLPDVELITKVYNLRFARLKNSKLDAAISAAGTEETASAAGGMSGASAAEEKGAETSNLEDVLKNVVSPNGKIVADNRTNSLIVTDVPSQFEAIDKVVALLDVQAPQVLVEVEMLDVDKTLLDEMGVSVGKTWFSFTGNSMSGLRWPLDIQNDSGKTSLPAKALTGGSLNATGFTAMLDLLITDTRTKYLARPRIVMTSNETSEIKIVTNESIGVKNTASSDSSGAGTSTVEAERYETGVSLKVTPQVDIASGTITLHVKPIVAAAKDGNPLTFAGSAQTYKFRDPEIRTTVTTLTVKSGETIVVGGLIKEVDSDTRTRTPFFGDLPLVGALFRHKNKSHETRELIVFITPHIIGQDGVSTLAKVSAGLPQNVPVREQSSPFAKKEEVDNTLERWEN